MGMPLLLRASIDKIHALLALPPMHPNTQDWELEYADAERLDEMVSLYNAVNSSEDERALMALIVASLDDLLASASTESPLAETVGQLIDRDWEIHRETVCYWALLEHKDAPDTEGEFSVTPLMRALWEKHKRT